MRRLTRIRRWFTGSSGVLAPAFVSAPKIIGAVVAGSPASFTAGTYTGTQPITSSYQWLLDDAPIPGATGATYTPVSGDVGVARLKVRQALVGLIGNVVFAESAAVDVASSALAAPGQVTGLANGTVSSSSVPLTWVAPSSGGSPSDYVIEYKIHTDVSWTTFSDGISAVASTTVTGLTASTSYDFRVTARNSTGDGTPSSTLTVSTAAASGAVPGQVTGLTFRGATSYHVWLTWSAATNTPIAYHVEWSPAGANTWTEEVIPNCKDTARCVWFPNSANTAFDFRVRAENANGFGPYSAVISGATTARLPLNTAAAVSGYGWTGDDSTTEDPATASAYNAGTAYVTGQVVTSGGSSYMAITETQGNAPPNATYWKLITGTYYFSAAGLDANTGTSSASPWPISKLRTKITGAYLVGGAAPDGTLFLFRRGDVFDTVMYVQTNNAYGYMFGSYGSGPIPKFKWSTYDSSWQSRSGIVCTLTGKHIWKHLAFEWDPANTTPVAQLGVFYQFPFDGALNIHSCEIRNGKSCGIRADISKNWSIKNCLLFGNKSAAMNGLQWMGHQIIGNTFDSNGSSSIADHHLYCSTASLMTIRGNEFINGTGNYAIVMHGACSENVVDQNRINGSNNAIGLSNGYIPNVSLQSPYEQIAGVQITRNIIENSGQGVGQGQGYGFIGDSLYNLVLANNTFRNNKICDISISASSDATDIPVNGVDIAHNSFAFTATTNCIYLQSASTSNVRIRNNAFHLTASGATAINITNSFTPGQLTLSNNQYYSAAGTTKLYSWLGTSYASLADLRAAHGTYESGSAEGDPLFTNTTGNFTLQAGSPCKSAAPLLSTLAPYDFAGTTRANPTSMGAYV